jgi:tyrosyl-tRNA synthetase
MAFAEPERQLAILRRVSEDIIPEAEFLEKAGRARQEGRPLRVKYGMDPTAPDLHLGNAIALWKLRTFQDLGHLPVVIIGDYTALVGDPSGANRTRPMLTGEQVEANAETYLRQLGRIIDLTRAEVRRNGEWFRPLSFADVVRLTSRATVARMIERDDFALRLKSGVPIHVHELLYPVMQAWDSVMVRSDIEIGGTDQRFNLLFAREFQRDEGQPPQVVMTHPILVGLDGTKKMSKSLGNYVGVTEPPASMFGKVMSIPDAAMPAYFRWTTDVPPDEAAALLDGERTHPRDAKEALARAVVSRYHGVEAAEEAAAGFRRVFAEGRLPEEIATCAIPAADLTAGRIWIVKLIRAAGFAASNGEARRLVAQGAVSIDGVRVSDADTEVEPPPGGVLRVGRLHFARLSIV